MDPAVNKKFLEWLERKYGEDGIGKVKVTKGTHYDYLGMTLDYSTLGVLILDMREYVSRMIQDFPFLVTKTSCLWNDKLFKVD